MFKPLPNIKPPEQTVGPCRKVVLHPIMPLSGFLLALFFFAFFAEHRFQAQSRLEQLILISLWACIFYGAFYWFSGRTMNFLISRNFPFAFNSFLLIVAVSFLEAGFSWVLNSPGYKLTDFLWHGFSTVMAFVPVIVICAMFFEKRLRTIYGHDPDQVPFWLPVQRGADQLQALLPKHIQGKILKLQSANQYVEVITDNGTHDLRMPLKTVLDFVPKNDGIHLHRSIWLRREQIREFTYENGNPVVIDARGETIPVSRSKVDQVKNIIENRR